MEMSNTPDKFLSFASKTAKRKRKREEKTYFLSIKVDVCRLTFEESKFLIN